jgi:hypothetical protein
VKEFVSRDLMLWSITYFIVLAIGLTIEQFFQVFMLVMQYVFLFLVLHQSYILQSHLELNQKQSLEMINVK